MAKKQSRRSVSLSRTTYERLRMYCETNQVSMSQFVEGRIGDFLGRSAGAPAVKRPEAVAPAPQVITTPAFTPAAPVAAAPRAPIMAPRPLVAAPTPAPAPVVAAPVAPVPAPAPRPVAPVAAAPAPLPVRMAPSAPNPGQKAAPAKPVKVDEAAAKRAADRIFTF